MAFRPDHELHRRRFGRNVGLGLTLVAFVGIVFGLTVAKVTNGSMVEKFDHVARPAIAAPATTDSVSQ